jgi:hypothetical protein
MMITIEANRSGKSIRHYGFFVAFFSLEQLFTACQAHVQGRKVCSNRCFFLRWFVPVLNRHPPLGFILRGCGVFSIFQLWCTFFLCEGLPF